MSLLTLSGSIGGVKISRNASLLGHFQQVFTCGIYPVAVSLLQLETVIMLEEHQQRLEEIQRTLKQVLLKHTITSR